MTHITPLTLKDSYNYYCKISESPVDYSTYRKVCVDTNQAMFDYMQKGNGNRISFGNRLGQMQYFRFKKTAVSKSGKILYPVNWKETNKLWEEDPNLIGKNYVYYIRNWFIGIRWLKGSLLTVSKYVRFYKFKASRTNGTECKSGNKNKIVSLLNENELYYLNFPEYDIQSSKLQRNIK